MSGAYYNEFDPFAAQWLRGLIAAGHIPAGDVDERSIVDVRGTDLVGYVQCHFFAGIGGWSHALRLAGWPDDRPVWTGSCPCQPFSVAGKGKGEADERNLWPEFRRLIAECRPDTIFGEQVAGAAGELWLAGVHVDLEHEAYRVGAASLTAAGVGAPHIRQRLYWVADTERGAAERHGYEMAGTQGDREREAREQRLWPDARDGSADRRLANTEHAQRRPEHEEHAEAYGRHGSGGGGADRGLGNADDARPQGECRSRGSRPEDVDAGRDDRAVRHWAAARDIFCGDGKWRRIPLEPALFPLSDGFPGRRVGLLRGAGNAIVPPLAAEFVMAYEEARSGEATGFGGEA